MNDLESNNKNNYVDLARIFLSPKDKRGQFLSKGGANVRNGTVKVGFVQSRETKQVLQETRVTQIEGVTPSNS